MAIQLFVPTFRIDECLDEIKECLEKGWTGIGYKTVEFEEKWKAYTGLNNAHFLNSDTAALHLAGKVFKIQNKWNDGDEIISTPLTFVSTNHAIMYENLKVVFADVDEYLLVIYCWESPLGSSDEFKLYKSTTFNVNLEIGVPEELKYDIFDNVNKAESSPSTLVGKGVFISAIFPEIFV